MFFNKGGTERTSTTDYLDGFQYTVNHLGTVTLEFVATPEGYYDFKNNRYIYNYVDHLGNTRLSYFKNAGGSAEVLEENNYYPFGLKHEGYNALAGNPSFQYQYNGKELQEETGWNDYGARMYMSDIARWGVVDPLAEQYRAWSPYNYAVNNPVSFIDPDGRSVQNTNGGITYSGDSAVSLGAFLIGQAQAHNAAGGNKIDRISAMDETGGGGDGGVWKDIKNFFNRLFGSNKKQADVLPVAGAAATTIQQAVYVGQVEKVGIALTTMEEVGAVLGTILGKSVWALPLMLNGDSAGAKGYDIPLTGAVDVPITTTDEPQDTNLYLYRNMRSVNGIPMVGEGLDKLGLRDRDVNNISNSTIITPFFQNGLSVTVGIGNNIPSNVPDFSRGKGTLFRIPASSLVGYGLSGQPVYNSANPNYGQIRPGIPMSVGTFRTLIQTTAPAWRPVK